MLRSLRQARALTILQMKSWLAPPPGRKSAGAGGMGMLALRALGLMLSVNIGVQSGHFRGITSQAASVATLLVIVSSFLYSILNGFNAGFVARAGPLEAPMLDSLPVNDGIRAVLGSAIGYSTALAHVLFAAMLATVLKAVYPTETAVVTAVSISMGASILGFGWARALRASISLTAAARMSSPVAFLGILLVMVGIFGARTLVTFERVVSVLAEPAATFQRALIWGPLACGPIALVAVGVGLLLTRYAARRGYEASDAPGLHLKRATSRRGAGPLSLERLDSLLNRRESGITFGIVLPPIFAVLGVVAVYLLRAKTPARQMPMLIGAAAVVPIFNLLTALLGLAQRMAQRDVAARAFVSSLPTSPRDLLQGKIRIARRAALLVAVPIAGLACFPELWRSPELVFRGVLLLIALVVAASALVSISFLRAADQARYGLEHLVVLTPFASMIGAPSFFSVGVSFGAFLLAAREARRAALRAVEWIEDAAEQRPSVWRALVTFAAFQAIQSLAATMLSHLPATPTLKMALAYAASAAFVMAWTAKERPPGFAWWGRSKREALLLGALGGALSGASAFAYLKAIQHFHVEMPEPLVVNDGSKLGATALVFALVILAPLAEEIFFRGWLQRAFRLEWLPNRAWGGVISALVTAFFFASVHPPISFVPVFVLGLIAGLLLNRTGGVVAGMTAHAIHNAVAILLT